MAYATAPKAQVVEVDNEGLIAFLDSVITVMCAKYTFTGRLVMVNEKWIKLEEASLVFETGPFTDKKWKDAQSLPEKEWYVMIQSIESFGFMK